VKEQTACLTLVAVLLAASGLCVGTRYSADLRRKEDATRASHATSTADPVLEKGNTATGKKAFRPAGDPQTLASRLRSALATVSFAGQSRALFALADGLTPDEWPVAIKILADLGTDAGAHEQLLLQVWAEKDLPAALSWAAGADADAREMILRSWFRKDPDAALDFLLSAEGKRHRDWKLSMAHMMSQLGRDVRHLARIAAALPDHERRFILEQAGMVFPSEQPEAVAKWLDSFEPALRSEMLGFRMKGLHRFEDKIALAHAFPDDLAPDHYASLYREWVAVDKDAAATVLQSMEPGDVKEAAYHGVVTGLFEKRQIPEAVEAFRAYPEYANGVLLGELLLYFDVKHAELLMSLVPEVKNPHLRLARYRELLGQWLRAEPDAARKWMAENEVPEQVRQQLTKP
jgi:hypothetical protein